MPSAAGPWACSISPCIDWVQIGTDQPALPIPPDFPARFTVPPDCGMQDDSKETTEMAFLTEDEPERDAKLPVLPGISRVVANNPGPMTYFGTNTYLVDGPDGIIVIDPGPEDHPEHVEAIMRHTGGKIALIVVS